jgi:hypothetical protein
MIPGIKPESKVGIVWVFGGKLILDTTPFVPLSIIQNPIIICGMRL